jgi:phenylacetate-CoA ligase
MNAIAKSAQLPNVYDSLERRTFTQREREQFAKLPDLVAHAMSHTKYFAEHFRGIDAQRVDGRSSLSTLPITRKSDLIAYQQRHPPFGGLNATAVGSLARIFVSPGPIYDPEGTARDYWRTARTLFAAGFRAGDVVHNTFSYHLTPAGSMFETGLHALGCAVIPGGVGQTEMQISTITAIKPNGYVGTPSFLKLILEKADELKQDVSSIRKAMVSGEAFLPPVRKMLADRGIDAYQAYGTADIGMIAYESSAREGLIVDEGVIVEIVRPGTGNPVVDGEVGEVVVTSFNRDYPLIRFATGDMSAVLAGESPCGRTNMRIKGWMGRADQTTKVRGMFVHPHQIAEIVKRHSEIVKARLTVSHVNDEDAMSLSVELSVAASDSMREAVGQTVRDVTKLRADVLVVSAGSLPNDGKVIDDVRKFE